MYIGDQCTGDFNLQEAPWLPWSCKTEESLKTVSEFDPRFNIAHQLPFCTSSSCAEQKEFQIPSLFSLHCSCTVTSALDLHWVCITGALESTQNCNLCGSESPAESLQPSWGKRSTQPNGRQGPGSLHSTENKLKTDSNAIFARIRPLNRRQ